MTIRLQDIAFHAYHGVLEHERREGNRFLVTVEMHVPDTAGIATDRVDDTLDYSGVYIIVREQMQVPSNLIEHVAGRIRRALLQAYPTALSVSVSVSKQHPPVGGEVAWATVEVS